MPVKSLIGAYAKKYAKQYKKGKGASPKRKTSASYAKPKPRKRTGGQSQMLGKGMAGKAASSIRKYRSRLGNI